MRLAPLLTVALAACLAPACDNDVLLLEEEPAVPVVYGVFNASEDEQTVSITKTFRFAEGGGARESAATPDSVYYGPDEISVTAARVGGAEVVAERVDVSDEVVREPGDFSTATNVAYRFDAEALDLSAGDSLALLIREGDRELAAVRQVVLPELRFVQSRLPPNTYSLTNENPTTFRWAIEQMEFRPLIRTVEVGFNFYYRETRDGQTESKVLYWPAARDLTENNATTAGVQMDLLFDFLAARLEADPNVRRAFDNLQLVITVGDQSFRDYRTLLDANRGITSTQELPPFSNVAGAVGLYGSVSQLRQPDPASLTPGSFDALFGLDGDEYEVGDLNFAP